MVNVSFSFTSTEIDHDQLQKKLMARNDMRERRRFLQDVLQSTPTPDKQTKTKAKRDEYTAVSPSTEPLGSELVQTQTPMSTLQQEIKFKLLGEKSGKVAPAPPSKPTAKQEGKKPLPAPPVKKKPGAEGKEASAEPVKLAVNDKKYNPLPPTPPEVSPTRASSGKSGRPKPVPRGGSGKMLSSSTLSSPPGTDGKPAKFSPTLHSPPPPEQAVYENTDFRAARNKSGGMGKNKKLPPTPPNPDLSERTPSLGHTPSSVTSDPELDVGGQDVYENTAFGDTSEEGGDLYANVPVSQQKKGKTHNGHHSHPPYQNVSRSEPQPPAPAPSQDSGNAYQNIHYPASKGRRRKH